MPDITDLAVLHHNTAFDLCVDDPAVFLNGGKRAYIRILNAASFPNNGRTPDYASLDPNILFQQNLPVYFGLLIHFSQVLAFNGFQNQAVGFQNIFYFPGIFPPVSDQVRLHFIAFFHQILNGICDLQLIPP